MGDTGGVCIYRGVKEHKNKCRNTNPSHPLSCSPALPPTQSILSLLRRNSCLARSPELHGWNVIPIWMLCASLSCQRVTCLVDTSGLEQGFHPTPCKQWLNPSYEARRASPPSPEHSLLLPPCTWTALGWRIGNTVKGNLGVHCIEIITQTSSLEIYA